MKKVLIPLASGVEEMEAVTIIDVLRRGNVRVVAASLTSGIIEASRGVLLKGDTTLGEAMASDDYTMVVIPGGMNGTMALLNHEPFIAFLKKLSAKGVAIAAICAAPMILGKAGLLDGKRFTAYPGVVDPNHYPGSSYTGNAVEWDGRVWTSRGPGTALDFALTLLGELMGKETRTTVEKQLVR